MSYATLTHLRTYLDVSSASDDALLTDLLIRARAIIDAATLTTFAATSDATRMVDRARVTSDGRRQTIWLPARWLLAQPPTTLLAGDGSAIAPSRVRPLPDDPPHTALVVDEGAPMPLAGDGDVTITGRWGWSVTPPPDIVHAAIRIAAWLYRQRAAQHDADRPTVADGGLVVLPGALPRDIEAMLARYKPVL